MQIQLDRATLMDVTAIIWDIWNRHVYFRIGPVDPVDGHWALPVEQDIDAVTILLEAATEAV